VAIPPDHIDQSEQLAPTLEPHEHYFQVCINEMYLSYGREWFKTYDPMIVAVSEFAYAGEPAAIPFVIGPTMLEKSVGRMPAEGMVFSDTRVAGPHPV
jgi:hypothetical protein